MHKKGFFRVDADRVSKDGLVRPRRSTFVPTSTIRRSEPPEVSPTLDADRLKRAYIFEYRRSESLQTGRPSDYKPSPTFDADGTWRKTAEAVRSRNSDPVQYMRTLFEALRHHIFFVEVPRGRGWRNTDRPGPEDVRHPPTPGQLTSPRYFKLYERAVEKGIELARIERGSQSSNAKRNIVILQAYAGKSPHDATAITLCNLGLELTSLFRYCLAMSVVSVPAGSPNEEAQNARFHRIAMEYYEHACVQYLANPVGYRQEWGDIIPPTLIREAERVYDQYLEALEL